MVVRSLVPLLCCLFCCCSSTLNAELPRLRITFCSQNLENFGIYSATASRMRDMSPERYKIKRDALVARMLETDCDIVGVQEVVGHGQRQAEQGLTMLSETLNASHARAYRGVVTPSEDPDSRVGILYDTRVVTLVDSASMTWESMPSLETHYRPQRYGRGPLIATFIPKCAPEFRIVVVVLHLKSKRGGQGDPAKLQFELLRMQMAAGILKEVMLRVPEAFSSGSKHLLLMAGDRNSDPRSSSALLLRGELSLSDFEREGPCMVLTSGAPLCDPQPKHPLSFSSVLPDGGDTKEGSYRYRGDVSWIDTILVPEATLTYVKRDSGRVVGQHPAASDHGMVTVSLVLN